MRIVISIAIGIAATSIPRHGTASDAIYPARNFPITPSDLAAGDVDNDGDFDFVTTTEFGLRTLRNEGGGDFTLLPPSPTAYFLSVEVAQLDADGKLDAITSSLNGVFAFPGDGAGGFGAPTQLFSGLLNGYPRIADLNEDGHPDVVIGSANVGAGFTVFYGSGAGPTLPPVVIPGGGGGGQVELVDLNGDVHLDVLAIGPAINSWLGDGAGNFALAGSPPPSGVAPTFVRADFDQDAVADLIVFPLFSPVGEFWKGATNGTFTGPTLTTLGNATSYVLDFDGDGLPDLLRRDSAVPGHLRVDRCIGPATFAPPFHLPVETTISRIFPHDDDADGDVDLWIQGSGLTRLECDAPGNYVTVEQFPLVDARCIELGDFDDDGWDDIVAASVAGKVSVALALDASGYAGFSTYGGSAFGSPVDLGATDVDLDGDLDVVMTSTIEVHVFENDGTGAFVLASSAPLSTGYTPIRQQLGDGNGDGLADAFLIDSAPGPFGITLGALRWAPGLVGGTFGTWSVLHSANSAPSDLTVGDVDGDGMVDPMLAINGSVLYFESQAGSFLPAQTISLPGAQLHKAANGDLDSDGDLDLLLIDRAANGGLRSAIQSAGSFTITSVVPTLASPNGDLSLEAGDADGDGRLDALLLGEAGSSSLFEVVFGDGAGSFTQSIAHSATAPLLTSTRLRVFDGDHDGRIDLGYASPDRDRIEIARNRLVPYFEYVGDGCVGSGGFTPRVRIDGVATPGGVATISIDRGLGGATAMFFTGLNFASVPLPGGCPLLAFPLLPIVFPLPLTPGGPGDGEFKLSGPLPGVLTVGSSFVFQALVLDAGAPFGFSATNAAKLTVH